MKPPSTGELNQKIVIRKKQVETNAYGGGTDSFAEYWTTYAKAAPLSASRKLEANQSALSMAVNFIVRARDDKEIYNDMLVDWRGQTYIIQNYVPDPTYKEFNSFTAMVFDVKDIMNR